MCENRDVGDVLITERRDGCEWVYKLDSTGRRTLWQKRTIPPKGARGVSRKQARAAQQAGGMRALRKERKDAIYASQASRHAKFFK